MLSLQYYKGWLRGLGSSDMLHGSGSGSEFEGV